MYKVRLPAMGQTMEFGTITEWLVAEGDTFMAGIPLYEVETDKTVVEVNATRDGTLVKILVQEDSKVAVGTLLAIAAEHQEDLDDDAIGRAVAAEEAAAAQTKEASQADADATNAPAMVNTGTGTSVPAPHRKAASPAAKISPRARTVAERLGVDLSTVVGTGNDGAITAADVERAATDGRPRIRVRERRALRGVQRTMSEVTSRSWQEVPQFVQQIVADGSGLVSRKNLEREQRGLSVSYSDLMIEAVVHATRTVPEVNASLADGEIVIYEDINVSVAVGTPSGLVVPVIHQAQERDLAGLSSELRSLSAKANEGRLSPDDVEGGTITVSNLGMYGVETGVPLVTLPQSAIVFVGALVERPVAIRGAVEVRPTIQLATAFDHRIIDGVTAARFTAALRAAVERDGDDGNAEDSHPTGSEA
jgi:pyruvate dehydrogenase E2 component (dihydrolipoamide acetyltransferase)